MKKLLNTLFVTTQGAYLSKEGECVLVKVERQARLRIPLHTLDGIVCFGNVACSPFLMGFCADRDVTISYLTEHGRLLARVSGPVSGNVLLRRRQFRIADEKDSAAVIAAGCVIGKVYNCRKVLQRVQRDHSGKVDHLEVKAVVTRMEEIMALLQQELSLNRIRGYEGEAANLYFKVFNHLIISQKEDFFFRRRNRRPPLDRVNCLLSFVYTLLMHDVRSALESVGLDPAVGFLHRDRPGRPGLALDLIEEFRAPVVDSLVLMLFNKRMIGPEDFTPGEHGGVYLTHRGRQVFFREFTDRMETQVRHWTGRRFSYCKLLEVLARIAASVILEKRQRYRPFAWW